MIKKKGGLRIKKRLTLFFIVIILIISISGCTGTDYDFRDTKWGMSREEVKAIESAEINEEDADEIIYKVEHYSQDFFCGYKFVNDKLHQGYYIWDGSYLNPDHYIQAYDDIKEFLIEDYGTPKVDEVIWEDDFPFKTKKTQGYALFTNDVFLTAGWETENTKIILVLMNIGTEIRLAITYIRKE